MPFNTVAAECDYKASPPDAGIASGHSDIAQAWYGNATTEYAHGVLGDAIEAQTLYAKMADSSDCALEVTLSNNVVFEDVTPRIADVTGDGLDNIITIESDATQGASLVIYGIVNNKLTRIASTPAIGRGYRWLAPVGTADFNRDNVLDVAYVETPHLAGIIKVWSFANQKPQLLAEAAGFSNHRIGENTITGGIANCDDKINIVLPARNWQETHAVMMKDGKITSEVVANNTDAETITDLLDCIRVK